MTEVDETACGIHVQVHLLMGCVIWFGFALPVIFEQPFNACTHAVFSLQPSSIPLLKREHSVGSSLPPL